MPDGVRRRALLGAAAVLGLSSGARAQPAFPTKPIRIVHGYSAASNPDTIARLIAPSLMETLGQSVIVDPKPGAGERIAAQYLIAQPPDGHTLYLITGGANVISATDPQAAFSTLKDFTYISTLTMFPFAIVVGASSPFRSLSDMLETARKNPGKLSYGHGGVGNTLHLSVEYMKAKTGAQMEPVAYKDIGQMVADVIAGRVDLAISTFTVFQGPLKNGQARALGVTSKERWAHYPDVQPINDVVPDYEVVSWLGLAGPAGMPTDVTDRLAQAVKVAIALPDVRSRLESMGNDAVSSTPAAFRARIEADYAKWKPLARFVSQ
ncbi:MAG: tripartite tricarboxylate transporter substrate-binding protein [Alphaproteobacteria bacterium]|nr:tripartite tricarboxylate transporter substrate-binding protein [Alphaproteobacteria bacterium]